jgi:hypothetical protein
MIGRFTQFRRLTGSMTNRPFFLMTINTNQNKNNVASGIAMASSKSKVQKGCDREATSTAKRSK